MSHRYSNNKLSQGFGGKFASGESSNSRTPSGDQRKFVPKNRSNNTTPASTLSNSFRKASTENSSLIRQPLDDAKVDTEKKGGSVDRPVVSSGKFFQYLPHDEAVAVGLPTAHGGLDPSVSQTVVDHLNKELSRLLRLNPREFWREVALDTSLHEFLDSYLQFRSRWYDFPYHGSKGTIAGVIVGDHELSRRVFMILFRMSSNKDPNARASDALNTKDHAALLQEHNLLNLPKLLDISAIYGHENEDLTGKLLRNAIISQRNSDESFTSLVSHFMSIVNTMNQRCMSSFEMLFSSEGLNDKGASLCQDLIQVMEFINDAVVSMDSFITAYKPAAPFFSSPIETSFGNEELPVTLARLHDTLLPSFERAFSIILKKEDEDLSSNVAISLKMLSSRLVSLGWKLLNYSYMSEEAFENSSTVSKLPKMFPPAVDDSLIRGEILVQLLREISGVFLYAQENQIWKPFLHKLETVHHFSDHLRGLQNSGWMVIDGEQNRFISDVMNAPLIKPSNKSENPVSSTKHMDEEEAILESNINQIKDLFPELGKGYLSACLEVYNQNSEEVIQRILEGTLHEDLRSLSPSLETKPPSKATPMPPSKDKGKAKITVETEPPPTSSSTGKFVRKPKSNSSNYEVSKSNDESARNAVLAYEYEDEYDDSYDDLGLSIGVEDTEMLNERVNSNAGKIGAVSWEKRTPQFYVKDGKNYSYKVSGGVAVKDSKEAELVNRAQNDMIHGLGRGGNIPLGAVKDLMEYENGGNEKKVESEKGSESVGRGFRGRGRGSQQYRKDRAFKKHFHSVSGSS